MAKKEYIGLTYEENRIRLARVRVTKDGLELIEVDTIDLPHPITNIPESSVGDLDFSEDYEDIFEVQPSHESSESAADLDDFEEPDQSSEDPSSSPGLEDSFDMTKTEDEEEAQSENERLIADYFSQFDKRKLRIGTHIPFGRTSFQILNNVNADSMKKSERQEFFSEKLQPIYNRDINADQYAWIQIDENTCLLAYSSNEYYFLNLLELSETYLDKKVLIQERIPDEGIWAGLARTNYTLKDDDITGLIAIGPSSSRILFMKGEKIVNVLPIITDGENSESILNTIFSKILFEIDKGDLPKITRLLLVRSAKISENAKKYFSKQFEEVEVDFLTPDPNHLSYADEILNSPAYLQPYMTAIGAAWGASKINEKEFSQLSILPEYIREKQRVLKLEWHGILILILIALTPLYLNYLYQSRSQAFTDLQQEISLTDSQIQELRPVATMTQDLLSEITEIQNENERLLELAQYSQQWSQVTRMLNEGVFEIPNLWLSSLNTSDNNSLVFEGYSMTREQIPVFASMFNDANIQQVSQTEVREQTVYNFSLRVNNVLQDVDPFLLEMPSRNFDAEGGSEVEVDFSSSNIGQEEMNEIRNLATGNSQNRAEFSNNNTASDNRNSDSAVGTSDANSSSATSGATTSVNTETETDRNTRNEPSSDNTISSPPVVTNSNNSSYGLMGPEDELLSSAYTIVLHSIKDGERAKEEEIALKEEGYKATLWDVVLEDNNTWWRIGVGQFQTVSAALEAVQQLPEPYRDRNFIIRIREGQ